MRVAALDVTSLGSGLEAALVQLADPAARSAVAGRCREWAAVFGWERMRAELVDVVEQAVQTRPRRRSDAS